MIHPIQLLPGRTLKESMASAHAVMGAARDASPNELVKAVTSEFETGEGRAAAR
jgi:hypothetical protein